MHPVHFAVGLTLNIMGDYLTFFRFWRDLKTCLSPIFQKYLQGKDDGKIHPSLRDVFQKHCN